MKRTNSDLDDITEKARAWLMFRHMDRVSESTCNPTRDGLAMDDETVHMEMLLAPSLIDPKDWNYQEELGRISKAYTEENRAVESAKRGWEITPDQWRGQMRAMERRAMFIEACQNGMLSIKSLPHIDDDLL